MQLSDLLALFLAFTAATAAWPFSTSTPVKRIDDVDDDDFYYLKTKVLNNGSQDFDGLYVQSYHTGAGLSDATLGTKEHAITGFLNGTIQQFSLASFPWTFFLPQPTSYDAWYSVRINAGFYTTELSLNETGLQWTDYESFGGWLVCNWSHGVPQLFWKVDYYNYTLPICAEVELYPEYIDDDDTSDEE